MCGGGGGGGRRRSLSYEKLTQLADTTNYLSLRLSVSVSICPSVHALTFLYLPMK